MVLDFFFFKTIVSRSDPTGGVMVVILTLVTKLVAFILKKKV